MICYVVTKVTAVASAVVGIDSETTTVPNKEIDSLCKPWPLKQALMAFDKGCISYTEKLQLLLFGLFAVLPSPRLLLLVIVTSCCSTQSLSSSLLNAVVAKNKATEFLRQIVPSSLSPSSYISL